MTSVDGVDMLLAFHVQHVLVGHVKVAWHLIGIVDVAAAAIHLAIDGRDLRQKQPGLFLEFGRSAPIGCRCVCHTATADVVATTESIDPHARRFERIGQARLAKHLLLKQAIRHCSPTFALIQEPLIDDLIS